MKVHIFNPETDYALAHDKAQYTPPAKVVALRRDLACLPSLWAQPEDKILLLDPAKDTPYIHLAARRQINLITAAELHPDDEISVWGWNKSLRHFLLKTGVKNVPSEQSITGLRRLSHRRNTISFHSPDKAPVEFFDLDNLKKWLVANPLSYLKAPWSSSGRGVILTSSLTERSVTGWAAGIINRQGSVMAEKAWSRALDFATEWECRDGRAYFVGFSVFKASPEGRYLVNLSADNDTLIQHICQYADFDDNILSRQQELLNRRYAPFYSGPLGIDMLADSNRQINICVEVNLRRTMGMVAAALYRLTGIIQLFNPLSPEGIIPD